jgi:AcrR family transcriptional regulator
MEGAMLLTGHEDLRVKRTIESIKKSFEELICEKDYEKITVKELCDRAMINKKTFYNYYPTIDDLLAEMQRQLSAGYIEKVKNYNLPEELDKVNREFFIYSEEQGIAYEKITCSGSYSTIRQEMIDDVIKSTWGKSQKFRKLDPGLQKILLGYINTVSVGNYRQWVEDGKKIPIEEMIDISNRLICNGTEGFFNN